MFKGKRFSPALEQCVCQCECERERERERKRVQACGCVSAGVWA